MVEATEGCDINLDKRVKRVQVHKIREKIVLTCNRSLVISKLVISKLVISKLVIYTKIVKQKHQKELSIFGLSRNFACKTARWGG
jgi:hypothetical protein